MKNILFHSGEFWFNPAGFPKRPPLYFTHYTVNGKTAETAQEAIRIYSGAHQLALADSVKFADGELINHIDYRNLKEGQTFFVEGIEVEYQEKHLKGTTWLKVPKNEWDEKGVNYEFRKVAVLSNSPVKSDDSDYKVPSGTVIKRAKQKLKERDLEKAGRPEDFPWPKAEPTVELPWRVKINNDGQFVLTNGDITLTDQEDRDGDELQSIAALLNRAPSKEDEQKNRKLTL